MIGKSRHPPQIDIACTGWLGGLRIVSDIAIPGLPPSPGHEGVDLEIVLGRVPEFLPGATALDRAGMVTTAGDVLLTIPGVGRYFVEGGRRITVAPAGADGTAADVRLFLLGSALGAAFYQRGIVPLHATTVRIGAGAVAICGESGAGKSTLGRALVALGHPLVADDVTPVTFAADGTPLAHPLLPQIKLWDDALGAMADDPAGLEPVRAGFAKFRLPVPAVGGPLPLRALCVLRSDGPAATGAGEPIAGFAAARLVLRQFYRPRMADRLLGPAASMTAAAGIARHARVVWLDRAAGLDRLGAAAAVLAAWAAGEVVGRRVDDRSPSG